MKTSKELNELILFAREMGDKESEQKYLDELNALHDAKLGIVGGDQHHRTRKSFNQRRSVL